MYIHLLTKHIQIIDKAEQLKLSVENPETLTRDVETYETVSYF